MNDDRKRTVNRLPARTWNWLHMNEAVVSGEITKVSDYTLELSEEVFLRKDEKDLNAQEASAYEQIETGMGIEMKDLLCNIPAILLESSVEAEADGKEQIAVLRMPVAGTESQGLKVYLHAKENSALKLVVVCSNSIEKDSCGQSVLQALQMKILAEKNAQVQLYIVQLAGSSVTQLTDLGGQLEEEAKVSLIQLELGGGRVYTGVQMNLLGKKSDFQTDLAYLGDGDRKLDMNYVARHFGKKTTSRMDINGVLNGKAQKLFRGTIDFVKGCSGAKGDEKEDVLLLSEDVVNQTIPLILCAEEDVEGNHGATIGGLDDKTLFYLASRSIDKEKAEKMIARAGIESLAAKIPATDVQELVEHYLDERM